MLCEQLPGIEVVRAFNDPLRLLKESKGVDFDLCILDIEMPGLNGLEVAKLLQGKPVIFTTAYKDYAAEAFDLNAIDYIRKPIQKERLQKALEKAAAQLTPQQPGKQFIQLTTSRGRSLLFFDQLLFIASTALDKRDKVAALENGETLLLKNISFSQLLSLLPANQFCQVNKKEIIAVKTVSSFSAGEITTSIVKNGKPMQFVLSQAYKNRFLQLTAT
ncbi:response regulator receiver domain protein [Ostertagia ostertagi]